MYYYNGAQRYEQFLQVGRLYRASLPFSELSLVGLALDVVDKPLSFSAMTLLVGSSDP